MNTSDASPQTLFLVERGWRGPRELALMLARRHVRSLLVIRGKVPEDVLSIITPRTGVSVASYAKQMFGPAVLFHLIKERLFGRLRCVVVNKEKTLRWLGAFARAFGIEMVLLNERNDEIELFDYARQTIKPEDLGNMLGQ